MLIGKHASREVGPEDVFRSPLRSRLGLALAVVVALAIGGVVWGASGSHTARSPLLVRPSAAMSGPPEDIAVTEVLGPASAAPSASASISPSGRPDASTPSTSRRPGDSTGTGRSLTANYVLSRTWDDGFVANIELTNASGSDRPYEVRLTFPRNVTITVTGYWNASLTASRGSLVFTGGPLAAGRSIRVGFQATKNRSAQVDPTGCTVNGQPCQGF